MTQTELKGDSQPVSLSWDQIGAKKNKAEWNGDELIVKFQTSRPNESVSKFDGRKLFLFDVEQDGNERLFMTSSIRLAKALKGLGDFADKTVRITRSGAGMSLQYTAETVPEIKEEIVN